MKEENFFPRNLEYLRKSRNITQSKLASKIGVDQTTIGRWEDGNREPTVGNVSNIAKYFNVSIPDLLDKDLAQTQDIKLSQTEVLFDKTKDILSDDDRATIEFIMKKTIDNYEKNKNGEYL